jgi:hypothetical protein
MRKLLITAATVVVAIPAMAQQPSPPANRDAHTPAVNTPNSPPNPGAPVAGANSFTEGQAKSRIEARGFTNVTGLKKDSDGVWRGTATQGRQVRQSERGLSRQCRKPINRHHPYKLTGIDHDHDNLAPIQ